MAANRVILLGLLFLCASGVRGQDIVETSNNSENGIISLEQNDENSGSKRVSIRDNASSVVDEVDANGSSDNVPSQSIVTESDTANNNGSVDVSDDQIVGAATESNPEQPSESNPDVPTEANSEQPSDSNPEVSTEADSNAPADTNTENNQTIDANGETESQNGDNSQATSDGETQSPGTTPETTSNDDGNTDAENTEATLPTVTTPDIIDSNSSGNPIISHEHNDNNQVNEVDTNGSSDNVPSQSIVTESDTANNNGSVDASDDQTADEATETDVAAESNSEQPSESNPEVPSEDNSEQLPQSNPDVPTAANSEQPSESADEEANGSSGNIQETTPQANSSEETSSGSSDAAETTPQANSSEETSSGSSDAAETTPQANSSAETSSGSSDAAETTPQANSSEETSSGSSDAAETTPQANSSEETSSGSGDAVETTSQANSSEESSSGSSDAVETTSQANSSEETSSGSGDVVETTSQANSSEETTSSGSGESSESNDETTPAPEFQCQTTGRFAHPSNCQQYIYCSGTEKTTFSCHSNQVFDSEYERCSRDFSSCSTAPQCVPDGQQVFPVPNEPHSYFECIPSYNTFHPKPYLYKNRCTKNHILDSETLKCVENPSDESSDENQNSSEEVEKIKFACEGEGIFVDPNDESKYFVCTSKSSETKVKYKKSHKKCPKDYIFVPSIPACVANGKL